MGEEDNLLELLRQGGASKVRGPGLRSAARALNSALVTLNNESLTILELSAEQRPGKKGGTRMKS